MKNTQSAEKSTWDLVADALGNHRFTLGPNSLFNLRNDPKCFGFILSHYKFAAKMACQKGSVLELGCSDGIGATILAENMEKYVGVDDDNSAIRCAVDNLSGTKFEFVCNDFIGNRYGIFNAIVSLDVLEHILPQHENTYFETIVDNLAEEGICVIGTPHVAAKPHAVEASNLGEIKLSSQEKLARSLKRYFYQVFSFGMNDEIMHTGCEATAQYLLAVGCHKKPKFYS